MDNQVNFHHRHSPIGAFILIGVGVLLLLNNFGVVPIGVWQRIWQFWPLVLVLIGAQMMLGRSHLARVIIDLLAIVAIALVVLYSLALTDPTFQRWINQNLPLLHIGSLNQSTRQLPLNRHRMYFGSPGSSYYSY